MRVDHPTRNAAPPKLSRQQQPGGPGADDENAYLGIHGRPWANMVAERASGPQGSGAVVGETDSIVLLASKICTQQPTSRLAMLGTAVAEGHQCKPREQASASSTLRLQQWLASWHD